MDGRKPAERERSARVTGFGGSGRAASVARLLVLDMVLWPGLLFAGVTLTLVWHARESIPALSAIAFATLVSVLVGVRQWDVMIRAVITPPDNSGSGEGSPRPTGRGETEE